MPACAFGRAENPLRRQRRRSRLLTSRQRLLSWLGGLVFMFAEAPPVLQALLWRHYPAGVTIEKSGGTSVIKKVMALDSDRVRIWNR